MARKRKAVSKRLRFEIFKRDSFQCLYCGRNPTQAPLHVDHVLAVANGGNNEPENLVTSCDDCNLGKGAVPLERKQLAVAGTESQLEQPEQILAFLELQKQLNATRFEVVKSLWSHWHGSVGPMSEDMLGRLKLIVPQWPYAKLVEAINITARRLGRPGQPYNEWLAVDQAKYFQGVLRSWRKKMEEGP